MAKEEKKKEFQSELTRIDELQRELDKERKKTVIKCNHRGHKGGLKLNHLGGDQFECKICKTRFNTARLSDQQLMGAIDTVHNAIQQIRCFSNKAEDESLVKFFGEIDYNVMNLPELYRRVSTAFNRDGGGKKKNKHQQDSWGSYGTQNLQFINQGKKNNGPRWS